MNTMSNRAVALGLALGLALGSAAPSLAQAPAATAARPTTSIVVVDVDRVVSESAAGKYASAQLRPQGDALQARVKSLRDQFQREGQAIQQAAQGKTATPEVLDQRQRDLSQRAQTAQTDLAGRQSALQATQQSVLQQIGSAMNPIITAIMRERGASISIPRSETLQIATGVDITPDVISRLDRTLPRVNLTAPAQTPPAR